MRPLLLAGMHLPLRCSATAQKQAGWLPQSEQRSLAGRRPLAWWLPQAVLLKLWGPETAKPVM